MNGRNIARVAVDTGAFAADRPYDYLVPENLLEQTVPGMRALVPFGRGNRPCEAVILRRFDEAELPRGEGGRQLKSLTLLLDPRPLLDEERLRLAVYLRDRLCCPLYAVLRAMLPAGVTLRAEDAYEPAPGVSLEDALAAVVLIPQGEILVRRIWQARGPVAALRFLPQMPEAHLQAALTLLTEQGFILQDTILRSQIRDRTSRLFSLTPQGEALLQGSAGARQQPQREVALFLAQTECASLKEICYYTGVSESTVRTMVKKEFLEANIQPVYALPEPQAARETGPGELTLNEAQQAAYEGLETLLDAGESAAALLYGVTGSGKTAVYIRLIAHALEQGRSSIVLVPEIALTPQLLARFYTHFGEQVAVLHSGLPVRARYDAWQRVRLGQARIVIGTRLAVFAPVRDLGLIIMDEEHEHTYKSESSPRYHAREAAKYRCHQHKTLLVLGSATPSVVTAYYARQGRYHYFELPGRYGGARLPSVTIADSRAAFREGYTGAIGPELLARIRETAEKGEQAIVFLNRRGASRQLICMNCGHVPSCTRCSVSLTYHSVNGRLICHQCGYSVPLLNLCPACGKEAFLRRGAGTQAVEEELLDALPGLRVLRMDSDTTAGRQTHASLLEAFAVGEADVLLGTQMVTKGLDFDNVTLVGVVDADASLYGGDWRCGEQTFHLITQVIGRAGRGEKPGTAVIQTASPQNSVIQAAARQDYWEFYENELPLRRALRQPPFAQLQQFVLSAAVDEDAYQAARRFREEAVRRIGEQGMDAELLGPAPAAIHRLNNRYRYTLTLRCREDAALRALIAQLLKDFPADRKNRRIHIYCDPM